MILVAARRSVRADPSGRDPGRLGPSLPKPEGQSLSPHEARIARLESLRHLTETLDLLFDTYLARRTRPGWADELGLIRTWLKAA